MTCPIDKDPNDGVDCVLGMASEINGTTFFWFTKDQLDQCKLNVDSACDFDWELEPGQTMCPAMP